MNQSAEQSLTENLWNAIVGARRTMLTIGSVVCYLAFAWMSKLFDFPRHPGFEDSLLYHSMPVAVVFVTWITFVVCVLLGTLIAGVAYFEAGLFCAAVGLTALSVRGGPMRYIVMEYPGPKTFLMMALELLLLYAAVAFGWLVLTMLAQSDVLKTEDHRFPQAAQEDRLSQGALALATQIVVMIFMMILLSQSDMKGQAIASVAISAMLAALAAHSLFPVRPSIWFWVTPLIVGSFGYLLAALTDGSWDAGKYGGVLPGLARPLPLDYASAGPAGALTGYWISRGWQQEREHEPQTEKEVESALESSAA